MKLNIQLFGGRGATSSGSRIDGVRALSSGAKNIMEEWRNKLAATEESEAAMRKELNKYSFNDLLKLAQRIDEVDYSRMDRGSIFASDMLFDNVIETGRRKNPNKWSIEFGKWREEKRR